MQPRPAHYRVKVLGNEPGHSISYKTAAQRRQSSACASAQSYQSVRCPPEDALVPWLPTLCLDSGQTARIHRLVCNFAERTYNSVGNAVPRLKY